MLGLCDVILPFVLFTVKGAFTICLLNTLRKAGFFCRRRHAPESAPFERQDFMCRINYKERLTERCFVACPPPCWPQRGTVVPMGLLRKTNESIRLLLGTAD